MNTAMLIMIARWLDEAELLNAVVKGGVEIIRCGGIGEEIVSVAVLDNEDITAHSVERFKGQTLIGICYSHCVCVQIKSTPVL